MQIDWDASGVDWEGPVPTEDDASSVTIEELDDILDETQKDQLKAPLTPISNNGFSKQGMIGQFALANCFVHQSVQACISYHSIFFQYI